MKKRTYYLIILAWFQSVSFNIAHPITPSFVAYLDIPERMFGIFFATMSLGVVIASPFWGMLADRGNPLKYMLIGSLLYAIGQFGFGYSEHVIIMVISRLVSGLGAASLLTITAALIVQHEDKKYVGKALSWLGAFIVLGGSFGYYLGGFVSTFQSFLNTPSYQYVFIVQIITITLYAILVYFIIKPINKVHVIQQSTMLTNIKNMIKIPFHQTLFYISLMFATMSYIYMSKYLDVYFNTLGYNPDVLGQFVLISGIVSVLFTLIIVPKIIHMNPMIWISIFFVTSILSLLIGFRVTNFLLSMYTIYIFLIISKAAYQPFEQTHIASFESLPYGALMGVRQLFVGLGMVIGPVLLGNIYDIDPILSFDIAALMILISLIFSVLSVLQRKLIKKS